MTKIRERVRPLPPNTILKVNGVSFCQDAVRTVVEYDEVRITHLRDHPFDPHACEVTTLDGRRLGFIPRGLNTRLAIPHPGGVWYGQVVAVYRNKTWGLRVRVGELLSQGPADYGSTIAGLRHRGDGLIETEEGLVAVSPVGEDLEDLELDDGGDDDLVQVFTLSGRLVGELLHKEGSSVEVLTESGKVARYPLAVVNLVETEPVVSVDA